MEGLLLQAELIHRDSVVLEDAFQQDGEVLVEAVVEVVAAVQELFDESHIRRVKGRPKIGISEDQLVSLLELQFSNTGIARLLHVSPRTIRRRIIEYGLEEGVVFSGMDDNNLNAITKQFVDMNPNSGERSLVGFLRGRGLRVQRARVRKSLRRVDPSGVQERFRQVLHRRRYNVCMPNSLWHIDGCHKLIRWRFVVHGGIDGYSRIPV